MYFSELILFEECPQPNDWTRTNPRNTARRLGNQKKQISNHLQNQKVGFCLDFLKEKTKLAIKLNSKRYRPRSLTNKEALAHRIKLDFSNATPRNISPRNPCNDKLTLSKINVGDLADVPCMVKQRPNRYMMSLTARQFNRTSRQQSPTLKFDRVTNNSSRLSGAYQLNTSTISVFGPDRTIQNSRPKRKKRKFSHNSVNYQFQDFKL